MFNFIKKLFGGSNTKPAIPQELSILSSLFDNGDFAETMFFLKKHRILSTDKVLKSINPHFGAYFSNTEHVLNAEAGTIAPKKSIEFIGRGNLKQSETFIVPSYLEHFVLNYATRYSTSWHVANPRDTDRFNLDYWKDKKRDIVVKNNPNTVAHCFARFTKPLIDSKFKALNIQNIDVFYIWLDDYSFSDNYKFHYEHQSEDLKNLPNVRLVFGTYRKNDFQRLVDNLLFIGYKVEVFDGYSSPEEFFVKMKSEIK